METTYTLITPDGQQFGPYSIQAIQAYIQEGRIGRDSQLQRSDLGATVYRASDFSELTWPAGAQGSAAPAAVATGNSGGRSQRTLDNVDPGTLAEMRRHASWFWWFAIIWTVLGVYGAIRDGENTGGTLTLTLVVGVALGAFGFFAYRAHRWAFVLGILLIALFAVEAGLSGNWIGLAIRCWAIFELFKGMLIAHQIQKSLG